MKLLLALLVTATLLCGCGEAEEDGGGGCPGVLCTGCNSTECSTPPPECGPGEIGYCDDPALHGGEPYQVTGFLCQYCGPDIDD